MGAKVLILGQSGFGKSTSIGKSEKLGIQGLNPKETFVISATSKPLPFKGSNSLYKMCEPGKPPTAENGNRYYSNQGDKIAKCINFIIDNRPEIKNIVIDDMNYVMQDYYMANAMRKGFDVFKELGLMMNAIFDAMERSHSINFYCLAHFEEYRDSNNDTMSYRFKTVGKMVEC